MSIIKHKVRSISFPSKLGPLLWICLAIYFKDPDSFCIIFSNLKIFFKHLKVFVHIYIYIYVYDFLLNDQSSILDVTLFI